MPAIPTTLTRPASGAINMISMAEIEALLRIAENRASSVTLSANLLSLKILKKAPHYETSYPKELIKIIAEEIKGLSPAHRCNGNIYFDWDNRFNKLPMPEKCNMRRILLRPHPQPGLLFPKTPLGNHETIRNLIEIRDLKEKAVQRQKGTPINSEETLLRALPPIRILPK